MEVASPAGKAEKSSDDLSARFVMSLERDEPGPTLVLDELRTEDPDLAGVLGGECKVGS